MAPSSFRFRLAAALLAGALAPLSFSPVDFWPAGLLSVFFLLLLLRGRSPAQAAGLGWGYGTGFFGAGVSWVYVSIAVYGKAGPLLAGFLTLLLVLALALFFALQCWLFQRFLGRAPASAPEVPESPTPTPGSAPDFPAGLRTPLGFAALWVVFEWLRGWIFTGFPWLYLGYAHIHTPLAGLAPVGGVLAISFAVALSAGLLFHSWRLIAAGGARPARRFVPPLLILVLLWALPALLARVDWVEPRDAPPVQVALVQANIDQDLKFDPGYVQESLELYASLSAPLWDKDLVLWPETAIPLLYQQAGAVLDYFAAEASKGKASLLTGILFRENGRIHNSIVALAGGTGIYHKQKLVPFGEYVPLENLLRGLLEIFELPMSSLRPGPPDQDLLMAGNLSLAPYICYEVVYPDFVAETARGADLLVTISNDTWFGASWGPLQHLQMAAMRALENGRYLLRATNNGVTAIVDERGNIVKRTEQFRVAVLEGEARLFDGSTPFSRWGSWPLLLAAAASLCLCLWKSAKFKHGL